MNKLLLLLLVVVIIGIIVGIIRLYRCTDDCLVLQTIRQDGFNVEIVDDACKEGLPHTTDSQTVRMIRSVWSGPRRDDVLAHERVHLAQKSHSGDAWRKFYDDAWGYKCFRDPPADVPAELAARLRPNPDTADSPWAVWRDRYLFFPAFGSDQSLRGAEVIVWDLENHRQVPVPETWRDAFCGREGCPHQYEHPHEISAEWLSAAAAEKPTAPAAAQLFAWKK